MQWEILCDFDGTIVTDDVTDRLLETFAAPAWRDIEREWRAGRIGSMECMRDQVALIDATPAVLDAEIARSKIDPEFPAFVALARWHGLPVTIVSDGLDRVIRYVLNRVGLSDLEIRSNRLSYRGEGQWQLDFPSAAPDCNAGSGTCKCAIARRDSRRTLLIGDGRSDFCAADAADFVFAKSHLVTHCQKTGVAHAVFRDFADAQILLEELVRRRRVATPVIERAAHG